MFETKLSQRHLVISTPRCEDYEPLTRGIQATLAHIYHFLSTHNLAN